MYNLILTFYRIYYNMMLYLYSFINPYLLETIYLINQSDDEIFIKLNWYNMIYYKIMSYFFVTKYHVLFSKHNHYYIRYVKLNKLFQLNQKHLINDYTYYQTTKIMRGPSLTLLTKKTEKEIIELHYNKHEMKNHEIDKIDENRLLFIKDKHDDKLILHFYAKYYLNTDIWQFIKGNRTLNYFKFIEKHK